MKMNLSWFDATTYTTTIYKDAGITTATASPTSGTVAEGATVTLSVTAASNYELDTIDVVSGGVTIEYGDSITFEMGEANVVLNVKSKSSKKYMVTENTFTCINGTVVELTKNMTLKYGKTGEIIGVDCNGTEITMGPAVQNLIDAGVLIKM